jgi:hypothetical protein
MIKKIALLPIFFLVIVYCVNTNIKSDGKINDNLKVGGIRFYANIVKAELDSRPSNPFWGSEYPMSKYKKKNILNLPDTCELIVGNKANMRLTLENIEYFKNEFNLIKTKLMIIHVSNKMESPVFGYEIGKKYLVGLSYYEIDGYIFFDIFTANYLM